MKARTQLAAACVGMTVGLMLDVRRVAPEALVAFCAANAGWVDAVQLHLLAMPWSSAAMLIAPLTALRRGALTAGWPATVAMVIGMLLGARAAGQLHALGIDAFAALLLAMGGGMAAAMAVVEGLDRYSRFWLRPPPAARVTAAPASLPAAAGRGAASPRAPGPAGR